MVNNIDIWSYLISENKWATLYGAYIFYGKDKFKEKELREKINNEIIAKNFTQTKNKRDLSNEINSHVKNSEKNKNKKNNEWYIQHKDKGYKTISEKGFKDILEKISIITNKIQTSLNNNSTETRIKENANSISIAELIDRIKSGSSAKIPTFQREYVWNHDKVAPLFLSIIKDFPIGSMLFWKENINEDKYIVLDGLQRTFSLALISNDVHAYIDYDLYSWIIENKLNDKPSLTKSTFDKYNEGWIKHFNNVDLDSKEKTEEEMLKKFNNHFEVKFCINYMKNKWEEIKGIYRIPFILLNEKFTKKETADIFNLINSKGVELNNFEINSAIWSKTPITLDEPLSEDHFISRWRKNKYLSYRAKIKVVESKVIEENDLSTIEPADFIYSLIDEVTLDKQICRETFFKNGIIKTNAIEPILTIVINMLGMNNDDIADYSKILPEIGIRLKERISSLSDIVEIKTDLENSLKKLESNLSVLKNIVTNKKNSSSINIPASLLSLMINIIIKNGSGHSVVKNLKYIFTVEYLYGSYGSGSTMNAWKQLRKGDYKSFDKNYANKTIENFINEKYMLQKVEKNYDQKFVFILALFNDRFISFIKDDKLEVDHIVPKALFNLDDKSKTFVEKNYVHSFYNLQLIKSSINGEKLTQIDPSIKEYYLYNNLKEQDGFETYIKKHNSLLLKIKKDICKHTKSDSKICKKAIPKDYNNFYKFIENQKAFLEKLIKKGIF